MSDNCQHQYVITAFTLMNSGPTGGTRTQITSTCEICSKKIVEWAAPPNPGPPTQTDDHDDTQTSAGEA